MIHGLATFVVLAGLLVIAPGPDMALITKNALRHGRAAALLTSLGVNVGIAVWTMATALGVVTLLHASAAAFTTLKILGAVYLIFLGVQTIWLSGKRVHPSKIVPARGRSLADAGASFRQGLLSNLLNPKIGVFFTSFLPQFIAPGDSAFAQFLLLGAILNAMGLLWLSGYALLASRAGNVLLRPGIKATLDRLSGCLLIGFGIRLAAERR
jgi:threonine/homoserine/homoserine lactone efflux protein